MEKLVGQHGLAQGNQDLIVDGTGTNAGAGPTSAGTIGEMADLRWTGTLKWQGTDITRNEKKEVHAQVTLTASKGNPCVRSPIVLLFIEGLNSPAYLDWQQRGQLPYCLRPLGQPCHWKSFKIGSRRPIR